MKKSEITVSMPLLAFEELKLEKIDHGILKDEILRCFAYKENTVEFDVSKAFLLCKKYLPKRYQNSTFVFVQKE